MYPGGTVAERRTGGQTAEQSTTPGSEVGRRAVVLSRLPREIEHGASLWSHATACGLAAWVALKSSGDM